jgi:transposase InsO family protein
LYELDPEILGKRCVSEIYMKLLTWKRTDERHEVWDEQVLRIQMKRYRMLQAQTEKAFEQIRSAAASLRPLQKKQLCLDLSGYPTREEYPCGMSIRQILEKAGISKTVYYRAINDKSYGLSEERRADRDREDFAKIIRVMEYKGFGKGVRQIYMMMPDLTGETFALSKIRRLLRQNGIRTKIRGKNPARQRMDKFLEKNRKPNILKREFRLHRPGEVRLTDVTYLRYGQGEEKDVAYGSSCIDPVTGRLLVFHISRKNDLELALDTLEKLSDHPAVEGALFHSDQGTLYFTDDFQDRVKELGMTQSMSKRGNCWDNAPQESFFGHFKDECPYGDCGSFEELCQMIEGYAWYYNNERRQWDRKRMTPIQYEEHLLSLDEEGFEEYMRTERAKYDRMKEKAEKKARERAKTLGV